MFKILNIQKAIEESKNSSMLVLFLFHSQIWVTTANSFVCIFPELFFWHMNKYICLSLKINLYFLNQIMGVQTWKTKRYVVFKVALPQLPPLHSCDKRLSSQLLSLGFWYFLHISKHIYTTVFVCLFVFGQVYCLTIMVDKDHGVLTLQLISFSILST